MPDATLERALRGALRSKLALVNQGFVHALILRFREGRAAAQEEYADNLAETRRIMLLIREMQRLGVCLAPDDPAGGGDDGRPRLGDTPAAILSSNLDRAGRSLAWLERACALAPEKPVLRSLVEEEREHVADLEARLEGRSPAPRKEVGSQAETITLEAFLAESREADPSFVAGQLAPRGAGTEPLLEALDDLLANHFLSIEQFFLHGFVLRSCGEEGLAEHRFKHAVDEMKATFRISQRILVLGGVPDLSGGTSLRLPHRVEVGADLPEALARDMALCGRLLPAIEDATRRAGAAEDPETHGLLSDMESVERSALVWLGPRLDAVSGRGSASSPAGRGELDAMLSRWSVG